MGVVLREAQTFYYRVLTMMRQLHRAGGNPPLPHKQLTVQSATFLPVMDLNGFNC